MVLDHVAQRPGAAVEVAARADADRLGQRDLDVGDALAPPERLEQGVAEAQRHQVLHRRLAEVVVDAERLLLAEHRAHDAVDLARARQVVAERLLEHDANLRPVQAGGAELRADGGEEVGAGREVHHHDVGGPPLLEPGLQRARSRRPARGRRAGSGAGRRSGRTPRRSAASRLRPPGSAPSARRGRPRRRAPGATTARMRPPSGSLPWRKAWNSAGISLRQARSPVPPKRTRSKDMRGKDTMPRREHALCADGAPTERCPPAPSALASLLPAEKAARFRALHDRPRAFVIANAFDAGSAVLLAKKGFECLATSSGAAAGVARPPRRRDHARRSPGACARHRRGHRPAGLGRPGERLRRRAEPTSRDDSRGRRVRPGRRLDRGLHRRQVARPLSVRRSPCSGSRRPSRRRARSVAGFVLTARAENFLRGNPDLGDTIARLQAYEAAGADVLFAPGLPDLDAVRAVCASLKKPFNFMVGMKGKSWDVATLEAAGVRRISLATSLWRAAMAGVARRRRRGARQRQLRLRRGCPRSSAPPHRAVAAGSACSLLLAAALVLRHRSRACCALADLGLDRRRGGERRAADRPPGSAGRGSRSPCRSASRSDSPAGVPKARRPPGRSARSPRRACRARRHPGGGFAIGAARLVLSSPGHGSARCRAGQPGIGWGGALALLPR